MSFWGLYISIFGLNVEICGHDYRMFCRNSRNKRIRKKQVVFNNVNVTFLMESTSHGWIIFQNSLYQNTEAVVQRCSVKKVFLEVSLNSQENTCNSLFFNKVAGLRPATLIKKRLWFMCFPVNFAKFLRTTFS